MVDYSYDPWDYRFKADEERQYFEDVEQLQREQNRERGWSYAERGSPIGTRSRREGVDESESPPLWWILRESGETLRETFSDGDEPRYGSPIETKSNLFKLFPTSIRSNHWFYTG